MSTAEIEKAIANLEEPTLKSTLTAVDADNSGDRSALVKKYQQAVLAIGRISFVSKLRPEDVATGTTAVGVEGKKEDFENFLVGDGGLEVLLSKSSDDLLKKFCSTLGLDEAPREAMEKQIADEIMLTGTEQFLNKLSVQLLKEHCVAIKLPSTGNKKDIVERLMVHIFELEPLEEPEIIKEPKKAKKPKDKRKKEIAEDGEEEEEELAEAAAEEGEAEGAAPTPKKPKKEEKKGPREKFVAPPLETICIGQHDSYVALYDNFNLPDLVQYCKNNNLKTHGKKKEVIKRILEHLFAGAPAPNK